MTVKNYVLDINKTSLQHPSIVLRQDDYNIYTINISVTENGTPVDLGSYTLNFLGITPAGAKIIDSKNFITNAGDLKNGKFSYKFPKEAAGSKGVYDVAYFRLSTTSGATSTIDLNLRVLGGIDLTADEVKDYITIDDTLRNTLIAEVFKKVDAKVDEHLATVVKGDKGDKGDPGKDGYMPVIGGRNYVLNSSGLNGSTIVRPTLIGSTSAVYNAASSYPSDGILLTNGATNTTAEWFYQVATSWTNFSDTPLTQGKPITFSADVMGTVPQAVLRYGFNGTGGKESFKAFDINNTSWTRVSITVTSTSTNIALYFRIQGGINNQYSNGFSGGETLKFRYVKIEEGNVATDWTPAPEDVPSNDAQLVHKTGNETVAGDKTFTGKLSVTNLNVSGDTPNTVLTYNSGFSGGISYYFVRNKIVHLFIVNAKGFTAASQRPFEVPNGLRTSVPSSTYFVGMYGVNNALVGFNGTQVYISTSKDPYNIDTPLNAHITWQLP